MAVERSGSGNGAHGWIFFERPVEARLARQLATALLTRTMETHYQLGLDSYDRLFPSQDTLPKGGFGNLIALPLRGWSRRLGNTVFLDDRLQPFEDQWAFLSGVTRVSREQAQEVVTLLRKAGLLIGLHRSGCANAAEKELAPLLSGDSGSPSQPDLEGSTRSLTG